MPGVMDRLLEIMGLRQAPPADTPIGPRTDQADPRDALKEQGYELEGPDAASEGREALKETGYELHPDSSMEDSRAALRDTGYQVDQGPADAPPEGAQVSSLQTEAPPAPPEEQTFAAQQPQEAMPQDAMPETELDAGPVPESPPVEQLAALDNLPADEPPVEAPPLENPVEPGDMTTEPLGDTFKHLNDPIPVSDDDPSTLLELEPSDVDPGDVDADLPDLDVPDPDLDPDAAELPDQDADQHADVHL